jgi:AbrB family looped-hinge helix DNA binding protein
VIMTRRVWRHRITKAGQVSIPAEIRARWGASTVAIEDEGNRIVLRPAPDDPIEAYHGVLKGRGREIPSDEAMRILDESERRAQERKWRAPSSSTRSR